jgi:hypothetical protein
LPGNSIGEDFLKLEIRTCSTKKRGIIGGIIIHSNNTIPDYVK